MEQVQSIGNNRVVTMSKIRKSARDEECTLRLPGVCNYDKATTVWAHSNRSSDGKGMGKKADDSRGAYACYSCHCTYDRQQKRPAGMTLDFVEEAFSKAMLLSTEILKDKNLI